VMTDIMQDVDEQANKCNTGLGENNSNWYIMKDQAVEASSASRTRKPLLYFGWCQAGRMACQANKMACKPFCRAWAGDRTQIHAPTQHKPFGAAQATFASQKVNSPNLQLIWRVPQLLV
jgi:hypothetical protein